MKWGTCICCAFLNKKRAHVRKALAAQVNLLVLKFTSSKRGTSEQIKPFLPGPQIKVAIRAEIGPNKIHELIMIAGLIAALKM